MQVVEDRDPDTCFSKGYDCTAGCGAEDYLHLGGGGRGGGADYLHLGGAGGEGRGEGGGAGGTGR
jgi:hypothetical protein